MNKIKAWAKNSVFQLSLFIFFFVVDLIIFGRSFELSKSDWAAWTGSVGTVATLAGTIFIAQQETRRRQAQEKDAAVVAVALMDLAMLGCMGNLHDAIKKLKGQVEDGVPFPHVKIAAILEGCPVWSREDLQPLLFLGNQVAADIAIAQDLRLSTIRDLKKTALQAMNDELELFEVSDINNAYVETLQDILARVKRAFERCDELLQQTRVY